MTKQQSYFNTVYQTAINLGANDIQAQLAASQASLETGYGRSVKGNNHFGIKAGSKYTGDTVKFATHEVYNGKKVGITDNFRAYDGLEGSVKGYLEFMETAYPKAWNAKNFKSAAANLKNGKYGSYATDPKYASKLNSISGKLSIKAKEMLPADEIQIASALPTGEDIPIPADKPQITLANAEAPTLAGVIPTTPLDRMLDIEPETPQRKGLAALNPSGTVGGELAYNNPWQEIAPSYPIAQAVSGAGQELGRDIKVTSGYRTSEENRRKGGAKNSKHVNKEAMDISMAGMGEQERQDLVQNLTQRGAGGFITYDSMPDILHVDMRKRESEFSPRFMHNKSSDFMKSSPAWFQEMDRNDGVLLPQGDRVPTPVSREQAFSDVQKPIAKPFEGTPTDVNEFASAQQTPQMQVSRTPIDAFGFGPNRQEQNPQRDPRYRDYENYRMNERDELKDFPKTHADEFWGLSAPFSVNDAGLPTTDIPMPQDRLPVPAARPADLDFREKEAEKDITKDKRVRGNNFTKYGSAAIGSIFGPVGALAGRMLEERWARGKNINPLSNRSNSDNFWDSFMKAKDPLVKFAAKGNNSSNKMQNAMTGPRGATYTASNGSQSTSLGNGQYTYYSPKSGKTSINGEINMNQSADLRDFFSGNSSKKDENIE